MPQFDYDHPIAFNGQIADSRTRSIRSLLNVLVAQESAILWNGNTADADYSVRIQGEEVDVTLLFQPGGVTTSDAIAIAITAAAAASEDLINVVVVTDVVADTNELVFTHPDRVYTVTAIIGSGGNGTAVVSEVVAPGGTDIGIGLVIVQGTNDNEGTLPSGGSTSATALGISTKNTSSEVNAGNPVLVSVFSPGDVISVMEEGAVWVFTEDAVVANAPVFFRIATATLADEQIGRVRSDVDGGDAVQLFGSKFLTSGAAGELVKVSLNLPATA